MNAYLGTEVRLRGSTSSSQASKLALSGYLQSQSTFTNIIGKMSGGLPPPPRTPQVLNKHEEGLLLSWASTDIALGHTEPIPGSPGTKGWLLWPEAPWTPRRGPILTPRL